MIIAGYESFPSLQPEKQDVYYTKKSLYRRRLVLDKRPSHVAQPDGLRIQRYRSQKRHSNLQGRPPPAPRLEELNAIAAVRADETAHFLPNAQDSHAMARNMFTAFRESSRATP